MAAYLETNTVIVMRIYCLSITLKLHFKNKIIVEEELFTVIEQANSKYFPFLTDRTGIQFQGSHLPLIYKVVDSKLLAGSHMNHLIAYVFIQS